MIPLPLVWSVWLPCPHPPRPNCGALKHRCPLPQPPLPSSRPLTQTTRRCGTIDERIFISVTKCHKKSYNLTALPPPRFQHSRRSASSLHSGALLLHPAAPPPTPTSPCHHPTHSNECKGKGNARDDSAITPKSDM
jgi:hypothetical protein